MRLRFRHSCNTILLLRTYVLPALSLAHTFSIRHRKVAKATVAIHNVAIQESVGVTLKVIDGLPRSLARNDGDKKLGNYLLKTSIIVN